MLLQFQLVKQKIITLAHLALMGLGLMLVACQPAGSSKTSSDSEGQVYHRAQALVEGWLFSNTFRYSSVVGEQAQKVVENPNASSQELAQALAPFITQKAGQRIALGIPLIVNADPFEPSLEAFEAQEIKQTLQAVVPLKTAGFLDEIIVPTPSLQGAAMDAAREVGEGYVRFVLVAETAALQPNESMGAALKAVIAETRSDFDILAWLEPEFARTSGVLEQPLDIVHSRRYVLGVLLPLLQNPQIDLLKGFYVREDKGGYPTGGGRVTELTVRPLLNLFYPELAGFLQPMCLEFALRLNALLDPVFQMPDGSSQYYGAAVGLLIDTVMKRSLAATAQVDLETRAPSNPDLPSLSILAVGEVDSILSRAARDGRIGFGHWPGHLNISGSTPNRAMLRLKPDVPAESDPNLPTFPVGKVFETIPSNRQHVMADQMKAWEIPANGPPDFQHSHTFNHKHFIAHELGDDATDEQVASAIAPLLARKKQLGVTISVGLPALNEGNTIEKVIESVIPLRNAGLVDEIVLIDSDSVPLKRVDQLKDEEAKALRENDGSIAEDENGFATRSGTREKAEALGIPWFIHQQEAADRFGARIGKGEGLWKSLAKLKGDIVVWIDTDIKNPHPRFVYGVLGPLLFNPNLVYVKGFYERPITLQRISKPTGGGRVTELTARPLLNYLYPELAGMIQPLSGEFAGRREALMAANFYAGYGVETGLLIDLVTLYGINALAQVDLEVREHKNQDLPSLSKMAFAISDVIIDRAIAQGRLTEKLLRNRAMWRLKPIPILPSTEAQDTPYILYDKIHEQPMEVEVVGPDSAREPMEQMLRPALVATNRSGNAEWSLEQKRGKSIPQTPTTAIARGIVTATSGDDVMVYDLDNPRLILTTRDNIRPLGQNVLSQASRLAACPQWQPTAHGSFSWQHLITPPLSTGATVLADYGQYSLISRFTTLSETKVSLVSQWCPLR